MRSVLRALDKLAELTLRASRARVLHPPTSVGPLRAYELHGPGDGDYLLVHGLGASSAGWVRLARRLRRHARRVVLVDLPAHGHSARPPAGFNPDTLGAGVREAFPALLASGPPITLVGNSLGGAVALGYALERPEAVRSLVLLSPGGAPIAPDELGALRKRFAIATRHDARRFVGELMHAPPLAMRLLEPALVRELGRPEVQGFVRALDEASFFTPERVRGLVPPATVMWGKSDRILPASILAFYRAHLPEGTVFLEPDAVGHSPHMERPGLVLRTILETHRRASGRGASAA
jgi:pimeloyl-ACP methyl ester carboxylesterase